MVRIWNWLSTLGVDGDHTHQKNRQLIINNELNLALIISMFFLQLAILYDTYIVHNGGIASLSMIILIFTGIFNLILNKFGYQMISKLVLSFVPLYVLMIFPLQSYEPIEEYYFWYPMAPIPFLLLPILVYDFKKEKFQYLATMLYCLGLIFFSAELIGYFSTSTLDIEAIVQANNTFYKAAPITVALFLFFAVNYLFRQLNDATESLKKRNKRLMSSLKELGKTQKHLIASEKMAIIGRMSTELNHELNSPIAAIKGNLTVMVDDQKSVYQLWRKVLPGITIGEFALLIDLVNHTLEIGRPIYGNDKREENIQIITKQLKKYAVQSERHHVIADYFVDFGITEIEKYIPICKNTLYKELLEIVYCEHSVNHAANISYDAIHKAERLISKLKRYSFKQDADEPKPYQLSNIVDNSVDLLESKLMDINVKVDIQKNLPPLRGYPDEMVQVANNLIYNAIQAMDYKGDLNIVVKRDGGNIKLIIEDSGGGINNLLDKDIFEPFFTTKKIGEGTGLGLNICREIVKKHNGSINWENIQNGARFTVKLPLSFGAN